MPKIETDLLTAQVNYLYQHFFKYFQEWAWPYMKKNVTLKNQLLPGSVIETDN